MSASLSSRRVGSLVAPTCSFGQHDPDRARRPRRPPRRRGSRSPPCRGHGCRCASWRMPQLRLLGHLGLGDQAARRRIPPRELDAGGLADQAASSVAPDEVLRPQRPAVGQLDVDAGVVLREPRHLTSAIDRHRQLADPAGQDALDVLLPQPEPVGVPGGKVADVERDAGEPRDLRHLSLREEPIGDSALVEDLDRACVQTARARAGELLAGAPLDDGDVDARQRQLARQHQPGRTSSGDHHRMLSSLVPPIWLAAGDYGAHPGACFKPPCRV